MKINFRPWSVPLALLSVGLLGYAILMPRLGFYWDDWSPLLVNRVYGTDAFWQFYAFDRPSSAWSYVLLAPLFGERALAWQIFTFGMRWLSAVGMWWTFSQVWPRARRAMAAAALLFLVYPVFSQQSLSVTYHQLWLEFALFFLSMGAMVRAARCLPAPRPWPRFALWTLLGLLAFAANFSISEYFIGVELLRPLLLWWIFREQFPVWRKRIKPTLLHWLPYLAALMFFVYWRIFLVKIEGGDPNKLYFLDGLLKEPGQAALNLLQVVLRDTLQILVSSWYKTLSPALLELGRGFSMFSWFLVVVTAVLVAVYLARLNGEESPEGSPDLPWAGPAALTGLLSILLGPVPAWITGRSLGIAPDPFSDRYAAAAMFGAALVWVAALEWLTPRRLQQVILTGALVGLAVGMQLRVANDYRWFWTQQTRFIWQMHWRAPSIQPGTALLSPDDIFPLQGRFATSVALNLSYPQEQKPQFLRSWIFSLEPGFRDSTEPLLAGLRLEDDFRIFKFTGNSRDSLMVQFEPEGGSCLWLLDARETYAPGLSDLQREVLPVSNLSRVSIEAQPGFPPVEIFGPEPERNWCYYYEKAALARQLGDWEGAIALAEQAAANGYAPGRSGSYTPFEWLPFVESYARAGQWETAREMTLAISQTKRASTVDGMLCGFWASLGKDLPASAEKDALLAELKSTLACSE